MDQYRDLVELMYDSARLDQKYICKQKVMMHLNQKKPNNVNFSPVLNKN